MRRLMLSALILTSACGYKAEIERLEAALVNARALHDQTKAQLTTSQEQAEALQAEVDQLTAREAELTKQLAAAEQALLDEEAKSARMLADRGALRDEVASMRDALAELRERKAQAEARVAEFRDLVDRFRSLIDAGTLDVRIIDGRMVVVLATDVLFDSGSAELSDDGSAAIDQVAAVLATIDDRRFQVEGHTDNVPIHTSRYPSNWFLAAARAIHVVQRMTAEGLLDPGQVSAASYGETRPVADNDTPENKALNRRIEIVVVPDLSDLPGYEELEAAGVE